MKLSYKTTLYRWAEFGEYSYIDADRLNPECGGRMAKMGIPDTEHYRIFFRRIPKKGKREVLVCLLFNGKTEYVGVQAHSSLTLKSEIKKWEKEALEDLLEMGVVE